MASDIESALFAFLSATAAVTNLVGERIYPVRAPEASARPFLTYHKVSGPSIHSKSGDMGLASPRFQFTCWADKYSDAKAVIAAVEAALKAYGGPTLEGISVPEIITENDYDLSDPATMEFGAALDAIVWVSQ